MNKKNVSVLIDLELLNKCAKKFQKEKKMSWSVKTTDIITAALEKYAEGK